MRRQINAIVPAAVAILAALALTATASAADIDPASAVRGSLGVSIEDLSLDARVGAAVFFLNAGCLLLFAAIALAFTRVKPQMSLRIPFRSRNFAR
jgi:hypothetical protein